MIIELKRGIVSWSRIDKYWKCGSQTRTLMARFFHTNAMKPLFLRILSVDYRSKTK
ncbi:MAG: hypothetical protein NPIRA04_15480 [Nitrospirales bacterium]|nr:MAG: hypothetical protein NPIRA04_15480 [Nitrospirales bacterium]